MVPHPARTAQFPRGALRFQRNLHTVAHLLRVRPQRGILRHHPLAHPQQLRHAPENRLGALGALGAEMREPGVEAGGVEGVEGSVRAGLVGSGAGGLGRAAVAVG